MSPSISVDTLTEIYTLLCRSAMNKEYYGRYLAATQRVNSTLEVLIAVGTTGSGISALTMWSIKPYGPWIWGGLTTVSALLAVAKPIVQLNKRIETLTRLYVGHADNYASLLILVSRVRRQGGIDQQSNEAFEAAEAKFRELSTEDDPRPNAKLLAECEAIVRERHPPQAAWYPAAH